MACIYAGFRAPGKTRANNEELKPARNKQEHENFYIVKYSAPLFLSFVQNLCNNSYQMILSFINIRYVPREVLKTLGKALGFQLSPRDLVNVNEWKIIFDPHIVTNMAA